MVDFSVKSTVNWEISTFYHANNYESPCIYLIVFIPIDKNKEKKKNKETKKEEAPIRDNGPKKMEKKKEEAAPIPDNGPKKKEKKKEEAPGPKGKFSTVFAKEKRL